MKKLFAILLSLTVIAMLPLTAFADLDVPEFDNWYVVCGLDGLDYEDWVWVNDDEEVKVKAHLEPGTRYQVHSYYDEGKTYLLIPADDNYRPQGKGFVDLTEAEMNKYFLDDKKVVGKENGKKQEQEIRCVVTTKVGVALRQGPAKTFRKYTVVPYNTEITYQYTYDYGGLHWGYTTYNGRSGWLCLDYTEKVTAAPTDAVSETDAADATDALTPTEQPDGSNPAEEEGSAAEITTDAPEAPGFFSDTRNVIVTCCLGSVIVVLTAVVILLAVKRKKAD